MGFRDRIRPHLRAFNREILSLWFAFRDPRVRWYVKALMIVPIAYVVSPFDLLNDTFIGWGQLDDIVVLRVGHFLLTRLLDGAVLADARLRAEAFLDGGGSQSWKFILSLCAVWGVTAVLVLRWFIRKFLFNA